MLTQLSRHRSNGPQDLVDLLGECHQRIRRFVALARQAASRKDAPTDQVVRACADVERYFTEALPLHVADEEESIEPRLRGMLQPVDEALDAMARQHQHHLPKLEALLRAAAKARREPHDGTTRCELEAVAVMLESEFEDHLALEESVIFPAIRQHLSAKIQRSIIDELRERRRIDSSHGAVETPASRKEET